MTLRLLFKIVLAIVGLCFFGFAGLLAYVLIVQNNYRNMPDTHDLKRQIYEMAGDYVTNHPHTGLVIAIYQHGGSTLWGFGETSATNSNPPNGDTIFEIGSITKVLTGDVLAKMENDGRVNLTNSISHYLPSGVASPSLNGHEITLLNLATHTSGLPRLPDNLSLTTNQDNPYANYKAADLYSNLATLRLSSQPGTKYDYSNYGFGLLGHLLELRAGMPYEELIKTTVCLPLGMTNTTIHLTGDQLARLTPGHDPQGRIVPGWDFDVLAGCGAFRSTGYDLLKFVEANLQTDASPLSQALAEAREYHFTKFSGGVGLGWQIDESVEKQVLHWHNGGTGGYYSFIGLDRNNQVAVVILSNYGDALAGDISVDKMGLKILKYAPKVSLE
jgi:D-alanyl-D-alanine-carboxypeptidase/D-alanyl-D-alanine-endopeptidase